MKANFLHLTYLIVFSFFINVVSIAQPCIPYPGYTTWMGYTNAWDDSTNWCPAIAPVIANPAMNVRIPGGPSGPYTYFRPVIGSGVYALTQNLRVESSDTIFINATTQSSLVVYDSLIIQDAASAIVCNSISKYPIFVRGHWENNGTFEPGNSVVTFDGSINDQQIGGLAGTTFYDLEISNTNHVIRLTDFTVEDSLRLVNGHLKLNLGMITIINPDPSAITRAYGGIQAEMDQWSANVYPFGRLYWKMGSASGNRLIPFMNTVGVYIPMTYNIVSGTHDIVFGTYGTYVDNTPLPLPEITNVTAYINGTFVNDGSNVVDRFYLIHDSLGINPVATVGFGFSATELGGISNPRAQQWINTIDIWENPLLPGQTQVGNQVMLTITDTVFNASDWWTLSNLSAPLGTGVQEIDPDFINAYPNPAFPGDILNLVLNEQSFHPDLIRIYSADSREVIHEIFENVNSAIQIPIDLSPGVYSVQINSKKSWGMIQLIILER